MRGLAFEGELAVGLDARQAARVHGEDGRLVVDFDDLGALQSAAALMPRGGSRTRGLAALRRAGIELEMRLRGQRVASLRHGAAGSQLARWLGWPGVELSLAGLARGLFARRA